MVEWLTQNDLRRRGRGFEPHRRHCVLSLSKNIYPSWVLVQPRKTRPFITERLLMGCKESNQTNKTFHTLLLVSCQTFIDNIRYFWLLNEPWIWLSQVPWWYIRLCSWHWLLPFRLMIMKCRAARAKCQAVNDHYIRMLPLSLVLRHLGWWCHVGLLGHIAWLLRITISDCCHLYSSILADDIM